MSYVLQPQEQIGPGLRRIALDQLDHACESLTHPGQRPYEAIHDARKRFKKIRALLRLVRDEIGPDLYRQENVFYRDAGRRLAGVRESFVMIQTLDEVLAAYSGEIDGEAFRQTREQLSADHRELSRRIMQEEEIPAQVAELIESGRRRLATLPIKRQTYEAIRPSLRRVYARGHKGLHKAYETPQPENFHEWRKRVKYIWYHVRLLDPLWPGLFPAWAEQLHDLSEYLGVAHDLAQLRATILERPELCADDEQRRLLLDLLERRRAELEATAHPLGRRIYSERPEAFVERMGGYWEVWQEQGPESAPAEALPLESTQGV